MSKGVETIVKYGTEEGSVVGSVKESNPFLSVDIKNDSDIELIQTNLVGDYNLSNVLTAVAVGKHFGVPAEKIKSAIENYIPSNSRSQLIENGTNRIILDAYNANPSSMKLAIENFAKLQSSNKILMLGGMMELGEESVAEHHAIIDLINQYNWKKVVLVGGDFSKISHHHLYFENSSIAADWFAEQDFTDSNILVKGSRSMKMEKVLEV
jgi:UDP-N-acetylmuramoyl-tripeptide--D-alanyl-D-alanine ligase